MKSYTDEEIAKHLIHAENTVRMLCRKWGILLEEEYISDVAVLALSSALNSYEGSKSSFSTWLYFMTLEPLRLQIKHNVKHAKCTLTESFEFGHSIRDPTTQYISQEYLRKWWQKLTPDQKSVMKMWLETGADRKSAKKLKRSYCSVYRTRLEALDILRNLS